MCDNRLVRRWRLFLNSAMVGFRYGESRLFQVLFSHGLNNALPCPGSRCVWGTDRLNHFCSEVMHPAVRR